MVETATYPKTVKAYFDDSYCFSAKARLLDVFDAPEEANQAVVVLESTIFHPQGGGQPSDEGCILSEGGRFVVSSLAEKSGVIWHVGTFESPEVRAAWKKDSLVDLQVDEEKRRLYARVHSAGHLLDIAMTRAGRPDLKPSKGYHFATGAYVEYLGACEAGDREPLVKQLNEIANQIIQETPVGQTVFKKMCSYEEAGIQLEKAGGVPPYIPEGSELRVLKLTEDDNGCPCGGTHVDHVGDIKRIDITKITKKGKAIRVAYNLKDA